MKWNKTKIISDFVFFLTEKMFDHIPDFLYPSRVNDRVDEEFEDNEQIRYNIHRESDAERNGQGNDTVVAHYDVVDHRWEPAN